MKLTKTYYDRIILLITICIIFLYHYYIQNGLEKLFCQGFFDYNDIKRPLQNCNNNIYTSLSCIGLPSGHAETATIFFSLLYIYKFISLPFCIIIIFLISLQRVVTHMHTVEQVVVGIILGLVYCQNYSATNCSLYSLIPVIVLGTLFAMFVVHKIHKKIQEPIPSWVDHNMYPSINTKKNTPYYMKILTMYANAITHDITFVSWRDIEIYMDDIIERINKTGIKYDAVVGLKTGGAIISDYISKKLDITNYKIKLTRSEYKCDKKPVNTFNDIVQKHLLHNFGNYSICEGIDDNIRGKNVILIDENVTSGTTILSAIKYLRDEKHVDVIFPTALSFARNLYKGNTYIHYVLPKVVYVWPWGYDN
jgi:hypoxanthine phosphoribosyltransferase